MGRLVRGLILGGFLVLPWMLHGDELETIEKKTDAVLEADHETRRRAADDADRERREDAEDRRLSKENKVRGAYVAGLQAIQAARYRDALRSFERLRVLDGTFRAERVGRYSEFCRERLTPDGMVYVAGGGFTMGGAEGDADERPAHPVTVGPFYVGIAEVNQAEWRRVMDTNPSRFRGDGLPVDGVSWYEAVEYCNRRSAAEGLAPAYGIRRDLKDENNGAPEDPVRWTVTCDWRAPGYRLPTEAEWEYAALGGPVPGTNGHRRAPFTYARVEAMAWYADNSGARTREAGGKLRNGLGLENMFGNLREWCWDWYAPAAYGRTVSRDPRGPLGGGQRVQRGGSWASPKHRVRPAARDKAFPYESAPTTGVRVVRTSW